MRRLLVLGIVLFGVVLTVATPAQAAARMQIGEIWYNSPGSDRGGNASLNHEWVQLHNTSGSWITMTGWTLRDPKHHVYTFGTYKIKPHGYVKIHTGKGTNTRPSTTRASSGPGQTRLVTSAATQQPPTTGPSPSSRRAACRAGFTRAKPARISSAGPNSSTAASAAASAGRPPVR
jgi:hypothetical protein